MCIPDKIYFPMKTKLLPNMRGKRPKAGSLPGMRAGQIPKIHFISGWRLARSRVRSFLRVDFQYFLKMLVALLAKVLLRFWIFHTLLLTGALIFIPAQNKNKTFTDTERSKEEVPEWVREIVMETDMNKKSELPKVCQAMKEGKRIKILEHPKVTQLKKPIENLCKIYEKFKRKVFSY
ncbi:hypothetical protein TNCT_479021 [Trichonephila clavata]|uniref:Uncharacterized protein n=1 Tax=Trichonephila clavata TaxID=2740835 RepID=A0A8X6HQN7_TRICU|nr:hypothetical protein TNCT_479021 [Trichonephila clavata]